MRRTPERKDSNPCGSRAHKDGQINIDLIGNITREELTENLGKGYHGQGACGLGMGQRNFPRELWQEESRKEEADALEEDGSAENEKAFVSEDVGVLLP